MKELIDKLDAFSIFLGAFVTGFFAWSVHRWDLRTKKKVMNEEMADKVEVILRLEKETQGLIDKFEKRDTKEYNGDAFEDLYLDIYESMTKDDLYKIYKKSLIDLVKVYKKIEFLNTMSPHKIYSDYVDKWEIHRMTSEHKEHWTGDGIFCDSHISFAERAKLQLLNNMDVINLLKRDINKVLTKKFFWLNPFNNI
ncbi:MAG: hypothetical protein JST43_05570 [Bacteroidetes bacterium]|nr:hypothetical protein [Bacteroidota bacterium]MBS1539260.1 hypothetical protein [Bacteroidota bacterium]